MINQMWGIAKNMLDENARQRTSLYTKKDTKKVRKVPKTSVALAMSAPPWASVQVWAWRGMTPLAK